MRLRPIAIAVAGVLASGAAFADPPVSNPDIPSVFCFRVTDIERKADDTGAPDDDRFLIQFEVLNWTGTDASGLNLATNVGTSSGVTLAGAGIDADGRGGSVGSSESEPKFGEIDYVRDGESVGGHADAVAHHSGRGTANNPNDWQVTTRTSTSVLFDAGVTLDSSAAPTGSVIPSSDLFGTAIFGDGGQIPGLGNDSLGDTAIDGGPGIGGFGQPYDTTAPENAGNAATTFVSGISPAEGTGNVLDGFVLEVDGLGVGKTLSLNWFLLQQGFGDFEIGAFDPIGGFPEARSCSDDPLACFFPIGQSQFGNEFGFGVFTLTNLGEGGSLPGPVFQGGSGVNQNPVTFFDNVWDIPNPTDFGAEFGAAQTADFQMAADNIFDVGVNASLSVPAPGAAALVGLGGLVLMQVRRRRSRR